MKPTSRQADRPTRWYHVYVVELRPLPGRGPSVYVGSSGLSPRDRFRHHMDPDAGDERAGSRHVRRRGVRLRPDLCEGVPPLRTRKEAKLAEQRLASRLERRGFIVYGSCRTSRRCTL